ncbi:uncharacterized protein SAPINGB_P005714 [Magnusiomyces paraingens]|uniref:Uncharacterized protein n=1 Tax=Magnusiomyces paraingens TaxID=2606893 RepID=A0A5E8C3F1_9ASCO|nr:uncharacterized protein SAPINGB_P005714 [Saprochaete ingens]VVT57475.1 unnamed protein product [Saprochaete ingens]
MSNRYSIDEPVLGDDDIEEDIVLGSFHPTERDRDLLRADEEIVNSLQKKSSKFYKSNHNNDDDDDDDDDDDYDDNNTSSRPSRFFSGKSLLKKYKKLASESTASKKKVGFASDVVDKPSSNNGRYTKLEDYDTPTAIGDAAEHGNFNDSSDSDDFDSDIEIDIREGLSRAELRKRTRKVHGIVLVFAGFIILWLLYNHSFPFHSGHGTGSGSDGQEGWAPRTVTNNGTHDFKPTTLVVSLDGFHPHYVSESLTPHLHTLMTRGGGAPYMIPSFPSSTFPNHFSMVTGKYPANHGIVGNTFWDDKLQKQFFNTNPSESLERVWWAAQPVWVTAPLQGVRTAVHMWPGSESEWNEVTASGLFEYDRYNGSEILENKVQRVFTWIDREMETRPELILTYVPTVDTAGHKYGISGDGLIEALKQVDSLVGELVSGLASRNLTEIVNLVVVSDHGMAPTSNERLIYLDDLVEIDNIEHIDGWPLIGLRPKTSLNLNNLYQNLKEAQSLYGEDKWDVYLREDIPPEWRFGGKSNNKFKSRIAPLWLVPKVGWSFTTKDQMEKLNGVYKPLGVHGYNNTEVLMRALFLAQGPYFAAQEYLRPFENIGLYNIMCWSLGIKPVANDAPEKVRDLLAALPENWTDGIVYPGVAFSAEILQVNSTYDSLFGEGQARYEVQKVEGKVEKPDVAEEPAPAPTPEAADENPEEDNMVATDAVQDDFEDGNDDDEDDGDNNNDNPPTSGSTLKDWYEYFKGKAQDAKTWMGTKIDHLTGSKGQSDN